MGEVLAFRDVTLGYDRHPAVHHLSGIVNAGELIAVCGPNGAGKSTLLKGVMGLLPPLSGSIARPDGGRARIAYLPQAAEVDRSFPICVYDLVALGLWRRTGLFGGVSRADRERIAAAIAAVGLEGFERRAIGTLSGGQMQRALFARLLLQDAEIILLDEPFTALDTATVSDLVALVERWHGEGRTVLAVLHDLELVRAHFPRTLLLARSPVDWGETRAVLTAANLSKARRMCEAWDEGAHACQPERPVSERAA
ncbi:zinc ABC transporter ATP-binding protein AztA [Ancylobacter oerskovii]|uniref:Zinc ABC transporter ATP-binding protein AztA n=1 Tax=Ancylobacter oerskovii TaxID=459519 RepID=A0ABW4YSF6_9HYPH|nr:zinc ABC transporter ATP-binding protein AztA [Ancylobacter oerskovii]MBS7545341.1 ABC transporter ATP-binding protein [Ancylobacter oerskovii]